MGRAATPTIEFEQAVVFANPKATKFGDIQAEVAALQDTFGASRVRLEKTSPDGVDANYELIDSKLGEGDIACAGGGDGTACLFRYAKQPVIPMRVGRACDLHHMLYGRRGQRVVDILRHRRLREIGLLPLEGVLSPPQGTDEPAIAMEALAYISAGLTGKVARNHINAPEVHGHEDGVLGDLATLWYAIQNAQDYDVQWEGQDSSRMLDIVATRGRTIAKNGRTRNSLVAETTDFSVVEGGQRHLKLRVLHGLALLALGRLPHQPLPSEGITFTALEDMIGQVDGEPFDIPAGWELRIGNDLAAPGRPPEPRAAVRLLATATRL